MWRDGRVLEVEWSTPRRWQRAVGRSSISWTAARRAGHDGRHEPGRDPRVSVVIPTIGRPQLVGRAIRSALGQSVPPLEVIVVVDGPDDATVRAVRQIGAETVRIVTLPEPVGLGGARGAGIAAARSPWIACSTTTTSGYRPS